MRPRQLLVTWLFFAACSAPATSPRGGSSAASPAESAAAPGAPTSSEAPAESRILESLPFVSKDGKRIAAWARYSDGARGAPKSEVLVLSTENDGVVSRLPIDDPVKFPDRTVADDADRAKRVAAAEAMLAKEDWKPLPALEMTEDKSTPHRVQLGSESVPLVATSPRLSMTFHEPELTVERDKKLELKRQFTSWSDSPRHMSGSLVCPPARADFQAVYADPDVRVALVVIRYTGGSDTCWEPDETYHAVRF